MTRPRKTPTCWICGRPLPKGQARLVLGGRWTCPDCAYRLERGETIEALRAETRPQPPRRGSSPRKRAQAETLFLPGRYEKGVT